MSNNTYSNARVGTQVVISGTTAASFITAFNAAGIYGCTATLVSNCVVLTCQCAGPFLLTETDTVNTPLAHAGITPGQYGSASGTTVTITGTIANPTFTTGAYFNLGTNWNAILNLLPRSSRGAFKCLNIAQPERSKVGTNSYRVNHTYYGSVSPLQGRPWVSDSSNIYFAGNAALSPAADGTNKVFTVPNSTVVSGSLTIALNGVTLTPGVDYTVSGQTVTFTTAPSASAVLIAFYLYSAIAIAGYYIEQPTGSTNASNKTFVTGAAPNPTTSLRVFYNGMLLTPTSDYTLSGSTVTTIFTPASNSVILCVYRSSPVTKSYTFVDFEIPSGSINSSNMAFTLAYTPAASAYTQIYYNGQLLKLGSDYSLSNNAITFIGFAPATGKQLYAFYVR